MRRAMPFFLALVALLGVVLSASGCKQAQRLGGKARPQVFRAVVSLSPSTTEILANNGVNLVGRTSACDYPQTITKVPVVGSTKPDYEALSQIKPDLIVYDAELYGEAEVRKLQGTGAKLYAYDPKSIDEYSRALYELGALVGAETSISAYVDKVHAAAAVAGGDPPKPQPKVALILPDAAGRHLIAGIKGLRAEAVKIAGGAQIGPDSSRFEPLSPEFLVNEDPDVIVLAGERAAFEKDPRFAGLKARRNANVYGLPQEIMLRRGARVDVLIDKLHQAFSLAVQPARRGQANPTAAGTN